MKIEKKLRYLKENNKKALITYITAGDPSLEITEKLVYVLDKAGADIIELGIPFSDPLADGPVIQKASQRALEKKVNIFKILSMVNNIREKITIPFILMSYYNPIYHYGLNSLADDAQKAGVDGFIIPDLPFEESDEFKRIIEQKGLELISFIAPTSTPERIAMIAENARGFIYCVSVTGITGIRKETSLKTAQLLEKIRLYTDLPLAVGFGISGPEQAKEVSKFADAVIVGSGIVNIIEETQNDLAKMLFQINSFVSHLKKSIL